MSSSHALMIRPSLLEPLVCRVALLTLANLAAFAVEVLCMRRLMGSLVNPLGTTVLIASGFAIAGAALVVRGLPANATQRTQLPIMKALRRWLPAAFVVAGALAISLPGSPTIGLIALWAIIGLEEGWSLKQGSRSVDLVQTVEVHDKSTETIVQESPAEPLSDAAVTQHLVRRRELDGTESIHGVVRVAFAPNERTIITHLAFCPPLATVPQCSGEVVDGPAARVKVAQVLAHGARIEVRLDQVASEPQTAIVEISAWTAH